MHLQSAPFSAVGKRGTKMRWATVLSLGMLVLLSSLGTSLEIKNFRLTYGPGGAKRTDTTIVAGDSLFVSLDLHPTLQQQQAQYEQVWQLWDPLNRLRLDRRIDYPVDLPYRPTAGDRLPLNKEIPLPWSRGLGYTHYPPEWSRPGTHVIRFIMVDKADKKDVKYVDHRIKNVPITFAMVHVHAPAVGFVGHPHIVELNVLDEPKGDIYFPNAEVTLRVLDESGTKEITKQISKQSEMAVKEFNQWPFEKRLVRLAVPLKQAGQFVVEIEARAGDKKTSLRYSLEVEEREYPLIYYPLPEWSGWRK